MSSLLLGTSSWSDPAWVGSFYPAGTRAADMLGLYAERFGTVEADVTYYRVPSAELVEGWRRKTPEGFVIAAKFPRSIVHGGTGPRPDPHTLLVPQAVAADTRAFLQAMELLGERCGPLVLQFPYFNRSVFTERGPFLERLDAYLGGLPPTFRYAVEVRNKTWVDEELCALLRRHRAALVLVDLAYMPHPADLAERLDPLTTDFTYARLVGDRKVIEARTKRFDHVVLDRGDRLRRWADLLASLAPRVEVAYVYANNHYAGFGPGTVRQLQDLLDPDAR